MGHLVKNERPSPPQIKKIIRHMAAQLTAKFNRPGEIGASAQWVVKLVTKYPCLQGNGATMMERTVYSFFYFIKILL